MKSRTQVVLAAIPAGFLLLILAGCGAPTLQESFGEVQQTLANREPLVVHWRTGAEEDAEADRRVAALLQQPLQAENVVQIALLRNRRLQAEFENIGAAQADLIRAGLLRNPLFSAETRFSSGGGFTFDFALTQDFISLLFMPSRRRLAHAELQRAQVGAAIEVLHLSQMARHQFLQHQATLQTADLLRQTLAAAEAAYELARGMRTAGNITLLELDTNRAAYEQARLDLAQVENQARREHEALNETMGLWGADTRWTITARLPDLPAETAGGEEAEQQAVAQSLLLEQRRLEIQMAGEKLGVARPMALLDGAEVGLAAEAGKDQKTELGPAIAVPIPLFDFGQGESAAAAAELRRSAALYEADAVAIRARARDHRDRVAAARERVAFLAKVVLPLRQQILDETQKEYNAMLIGAFQLVDAKRDTIQAAQQYIEALQAYWEARVDYDFLLQGAMLP